MQLPSTNEGPRGVIRLGTGRLREMAAKGKSRVTMLTIRTAKLTQNSHTYRPNA
jgi:hypothetical protein